MFDVKIKFSSIPKVGFAHHFYTNKEYSVKYGYQKGIEIVYVESGELTGEFEKRRFVATEGSFLILFRHLDIKLFSDGQNHHSHCSMLLSMEHDFELVETPDDLKNLEGGLVLPFVTSACSETESLKKLLFSAVSDMGISKEQNELSSALAGLAILRQLSRLYKKQIRQNQDTQSIIGYKIKKYITENINKEITLSDIAKELSKTPNYLNYVFKTRYGVSVKQYVNQEKVRIISEMLHNREIDFKSACESVGILDVSYGYRLFKKHTGMTLKEYLSAETKGL